MEVHSLLKGSKYQQTHQSGFTLIELLVVVVIMGILAAVGLPSMLAQAGKANQARAQNSVGAINRAQQAYFMENATFASSLHDLRIGNLTLEGYTINISVTSAEAKAEATPTRIGLTTYCGKVLTLSAGAQALTTATLSSGACS
jgi:type IV pilus assembly protein PilA